MEMGKSRHLVQSIPSVLSTNNNNNNNEESTATVMRSNMLCGSIGLIHHDHSYYSSTKPMDSTEKTTLAAMEIENEIEISTTPAPIDRRAPNQKKVLRCSQCSFTSSKPSILQIHSNTHTGARPYKCQACEKSFAQPSTLRDHERVHIDERPFKCQYCPADFKWPNSLKSHLVAHNRKSSRNQVKCNESRNVKKNSSSIGEGGQKSNGKKKNDKSAPTLQQRNASSSPHHHQQQENEVELAIVKMEVSFE